MVRLALLFCVVVVSNPYRLSSSISFYRFLLGIRSVTATSSNKLLLQYDIPSKARGASKEVGLELEFDTGTRRLADAQVSPCLYQLRFQRAE